MLNVIRLAQNYWLANSLYEYDFVLLLPRTDEKIKAAFTAKLKERRGRIITGKEADLLIALYSLYEFSGNIIVGSFDAPYGRKLRNIPADEDTIIDKIILGGMSGTRP